MRKLLFFTCLLIITKVNANDGSFYALGNTLVPLKETTIRMKKEILTLERKGGWMQVDIYFEFFNPGPEKELTVGFVTPPAAGDIAEGTDDRHPQIRDFMVMADNRLLPYKIVRADQSGFKLGEKVAMGFEFIYHFTIKFPQGTTIIRHSYRYRGGTSVEATNDFAYRLTTGTGWAGGMIDDFELNINMGDDVFFSVPDGFGKAANWTVIGIGKISAATPYPFMQDERKPIRMVYLRYGKLQYRTTAFKPTSDLSIVLWNLHNEVNLWGGDTGFIKMDNLYEIAYGNDSTELKQIIGQISDNELRFYRNLNYARAGYDFKDASLKKLFEKFTWYIPDPSVTTDRIQEYYLKRDVLRWITEEEKKRKQKTAGT